MAQKLVVEEGKESGGFDNEGWLRENGLYDEGLAKGLAENRIDLKELGQMTAIQIERVLREELKMTSLFRVFKIVNRLVRSFQGESSKVTRMGGSTSAAAASHSESNETLLKSLIIGSLKNKDDLREWLIRKVSSKMDVASIELIYRGSRDSFRAQSFHDRCNWQGPTISIILSDTGHVFGGFVELSWSSSNAYKADESAFLFLLAGKKSILDRYKVTAPAYFPVHPDGVKTAVYHYTSYGPTFGNGHDFVIRDKGNEKWNNYVNFPYAFTNEERNWPYCTKDKKDLLAGLEYFRVKEIEVFSVRKSH